MTVLTETVNDSTAVTDESTGVSETVGEILKKKKKCYDSELYLRILHAPDDVFEIRSMECPEKRGGRFKSTAVGYFDDAENAARKAMALNNREPPAVHVTLNPVDPVLLARADNRIEPKAKTTAKDQDIDRRRWIYIDVDCERGELNGEKSKEKKSGMSATDAEATAAWELADEVVEYLTSIGWPEPLRAFSGNGASLLARVDLPNDADAKKLHEDLLAALSGKFKDKRGSIDTTTSNAARLTKVSGTWARKGTDFKGRHDRGNPARPHRRTWFVPPSAELQLVTPEQIKVVIDANPVDAPEASKSKAKASEQASASHGLTAEPWTGGEWGERLVESVADMEAFIAHAGLEVGPGKPFHGGTLWTIKGECPLCAGHHGADSAPFVAIAPGKGGEWMPSAKCHHDGCRWNWPDMYRHYGGRYPSRRSASVKQDDAKRFDTPGDIIVSDDFSKRRYDASGRVEGCCLVKIRGSKTTYELTTPEQPDTPVVFHPWPPAHPKFNSMMLDALDVDCRVRNLTRGAYLAFANCIIGQMTTRIADAEADPHRMIANVFLRFVAGDSPGESWNPTDADNVWELRKSINHFGGPGSTEILAKLDGRIYFAVEGFETYLKHIAGRDDTAPAIYEALKTIGCRKGQRKKIPTIADTRVRYWSIDEGQLSEVEDYVDHGHRPGAVR